MCQASRGMDERYTLCAFRHSYGLETAHGTCFRLLFLPDQYLNLSKKQPELLGYRLKGWNLLRQETKVCFHRGRHEEFKDFFSLKDGIVFCNDVCSVMEVLGHEYNPDQWRLFTDSSKVSLKLLLLRNGNGLLSVPLAHAANMKESYERTKLLLGKIKYDEFKWKLCGDLKVVALLLRMQLGYTKYCCFLCE